MKGGDGMSREKIMQALENEEVRKELLDQLEIEELEDREAPSVVRWLCYRPVPW
jgi:hypothetical protein